MKADIVLLPGDGIGPEVVQEGRRVLDAIAERFGHTFKYVTRNVGGAAIDKEGTALSDETLEICRKSDAILLGAVGGPKWDDPSAKIRPEQGLLGLRRGLKLYANVRPIKAHPEFVSSSPLRPVRLEGVDFIIVRELTGGIYFGEPRFRETLPDGTIRAVDTMVYTDVEVRRIGRLAFRIAQGRRKRVISVDKANVLESSRLWRQVMVETSHEFPDVQLSHQLVDSCAMRLITHGPDFDVIVTTNMFGDILSDEASVLTGSIGILPSASLGEGRLGLYEPVHGSAPDIAGLGKANPLGTILSVAMLLRHSLELEEEAEAVEAAVDEATSGGARTADLGGTASTEQVGQMVCEAILSTSA
jgi:3-isopropylmalate dehydrogenase